MTKTNYTIYDKRTQLKDHFDPQKENPPSLILSRLPFLQPHNVGQRHVTRRVPTPQTNSHTMYEPSIRPSVQCFTLDPSLSLLPLPRSLCSPTRLSQLCSCFCFSCFVFSVLVSFLKVQHFIFKALFFSTNIVVQTIIFFFVISYYGLIILLFICK